MVKIIIISLIIFLTLWLFLYMTPRLGANQLPRGLYSYNAPMIGINNPDYYPATNDAIHVTGVGPGEVIGLDTITSCYQPNWKVLYGDTHATNVGYSTIYEPTGLIWQADAPIDIHSCLGNSIHEVKYGRLSSGIHQ